MERVNNFRLYAILDLGYVKEAQIEEYAKRLVEISPAYIQLRAKGCSVDEVEKMAERVCPICQQAGVKFIVNDFLDIAKRCGADGVHLGQDDGDILEARKKVNPSFILGKSTHSLKQAQQAITDGADYIGFGPLFATDTKPGRQPIGLNDIETLKRWAPKNYPIFCIGGINDKTLPLVVEAGAEQVVIVSWLLRQLDFHAAVEQINSFWNC